MSKDNIPDSADIAATYGPGALRHTGRVVVDPDVQHGLEALRELVIAIEDPGLSMPERRSKFLRFARESVDVAVAAYQHEREQVEEFITLRLKAILPTQARDLLKVLRERARGEVDETGFLRIAGDADAKETIFDHGDEADVAWRLMTDHLGAHVVYDMELLHVYNPETGAWHGEERSAMIQRIMRHYRKSWRVHKTTNGEQKLKRMTWRHGTMAGVCKIVEGVHHQPGYFTRHVKGCGFTNGLVLPDGRVRPHSPTHRLLGSEVLDFPYRPIGSEAEIWDRCPRWCRFLESIWYGDSDWEDKFCTLHVWLGRAVLGLATTFEKMLVLKGRSAGNGKSTLIKIIRAAFPEGSRCAVPPELMGERFQNVPLATARINLVADASESRLEGVGDLKGAISGDEMQFERKNKGTFTRSPRAAHVVAFNKAPHVSDRTNGFWRRMLILTFNRSFNNSPDLDLHIERPIIEQEMPDVVASWLYYAIEHGDYPFVEPASHHIELAKWRGHGNNVIAFASQFLDHGADDLVSDALRYPRVYRIYQEWCKRNGVRPLSRAHMDEELDAQGWRRSRSSSYRGWLVKPRPGTEVMAIMHPPSGFRGF